MDFDDLGMIGPAAATDDWTALSLSDQAQKLNNLVLVAVTAKIRSFRLAVEQRAHRELFGDEDKRVIEIAAELQALKRPLDLTNILQSRFTIGEEKLMRYFVEEQVDKLANGDDSRCCLAPSFLFLSELKCNYMLIENDAAMVIPIPELPLEPFSKRNTTYTEKILISLKAKMLIFYLTVEREARIKANHPDGHLIEKLTISLNILRGILDTTGMFNDLCDQHTSEFEINERAAKLDLCTDICSRYLNTLLYRISADLNTIVFELRFPQLWPTVPNYRTPKMISMIKRERERVFRLTEEYEHMRRLEGDGHEMVDGIEVALQTVRRMVLEMNQLAK